MRGITRPTAQARDEVSHARPISTWSSPPTAALIAIPASTLAADQGLPISRNTAASGAVA